MLTLTMSMERLSRLRLVDDAGSHMVSRSLDMLFHLPSAREAKRDEASRSFLVSSLRVIGRGFFLLTKRWLLAC